MAETVVTYRIKETPTHRIPEIILTAHNEDFDAPHVWHYQLENIMWNGNNTIRGPVKAFDGDRINPAFLHHLAKEHKQRSEKAEAEIQRAKNWPVASKKRCGDTIMTMREDLIDELTRLGLELRKFSMVKNKEAKTVKFVVKYLWNGKLREGWIEFAERPMKELSHKDIAKVIYSYCKP